MTSQVEFGLICGQVVCVRCRWSSSQLTLRQATRSFTLETFSMPSTLLLEDPSKYQLKTSSSLYSVCEAQWWIQKLMKGTEDNVSSPSSFIANAHNELYCLLYGKRWLIEKKFWVNREGDGRLHFSSLNPPLDTHTHTHTNTPSLMFCISACAASSYAVSFCCKHN